MSFPVRFRPQLTDEITEAMAWYYERSPGLEKDFFRTFDDGGSGRFEVLGFSGGRHVEASLALSL